MTADEAQYLSFVSRLPRSFVTDVDVRRNWQASAEEARKAGSLGDVPLIVLTGGKFNTPADPRDVEDARAFHQLWVHELQPKLARLSSRGRQIIIEKSGHGIQFEAPDVLIGAIRELIVESRGELPR
jgi:pimeloyl-ACP methyl ester carboxylesterase